MLLLNNTLSDVEIQNTNNTSFSDPRKNSVKQTISGTLEILSLFDLAMSLNSNKKSGKLNIHTSKFEAYIIFDQGNIIHADFYGRTGSKALAMIFIKSDGDSEAQFLFEAEEDSIATDSPISITMPFKELLFKIAVALDSYRNKSE